LALLDCYTNNIKKPIWTCNFWFRKSLICQKRLADTYWCTCNRIRTRLWIIWWINDINNTWWIIGTIRLYIGTIRWIIGCGSNVWNLTIYPFDQANLLSAWFYGPRSMVRHSPWTNMILILLLTCSMPDILLTLIYNS